MKTTLVLAITVAAATLSAGVALAEYPERPITMIVPWSAGGGTDAVARALAAVAATDSGSMSPAATLRRSVRAAASASTPVPVPTSTIRRGRRRFISASKARRQPRVVP